MSKFFIPLDYAITSTTKATSVNSVLVRLFLVSVVGLSITACGPSKLSEAEACKMAMADFQNLKPSLSLPNGPYCIGDHSIHESSCSGFTSNSEQGWAKISIPFTTHGCYNEPLSGRYDYTFQRFDQGWKIVK